MNKNIIPFWQGVWQFSRRNWHELSVACVALLVCLRMFAAPDILFFKDSMDWGFICWSQRFPFLLAGFREAFLQGAFYPRWLPELMGGNGYPTFVFYQPGAFFFALPFALLIPNMVLATKVALFAMLALGGIGALRLCRLYVPLTPALAATSLYLLSPYVFTTLYIRATYAELLGAMICPWCLYFGVTLQRHCSAQKPFLKPALGFACSLGALFLTHPFITLHFSVLLMLALLALWSEIRFDKWLALVLALCGCLALVIASPYLIGVLQMRESINYNGIHFIYFDWLQPLTTLLAANPVSNILVVIGLYQHRRQRISWALAATFVWLLFINSQLSQSVWENFAPLNITQVPYRSYAVDILVRLLASAFAFAWIDQYARTRNWRFAVPACALITFAAMAANPLPVVQHARLPFSWSEFSARLENHPHEAYRQTTMQSYNDESLSYDFLPKQVDLAQLKKDEPPFSRPLMWENPPAALNLYPNPDNSPYFYDVAVTIKEDKQLGARPAELYLRQFYFPGWKLMVNGELTPENQLTNFAWRWQSGNDGRIVVQFLRPGTFRVQAWYSGPPNAKERNALMIGLIILLLYGLVQVQCRKQPNDK